jgi:hypothetical protein
MTLALQCLVGLTLLVGGAVAALPDLWHVRTPRHRPMQSAGTAPPLWIVQGPPDRWFVNGEPMTRSGIASLLRDPGQGKDGAREVRFLPSASLSLGEVSGSLAWLRGLNGGPVVLGLPRQEGP